MIDYKRISNQEITHLASLLNAAHLLAEESDQKLQELVTRYPDAFPPEILGRARPDSPEGEESQAAADTA
jgi:hypothetical protein